MSTSFRSELYQVDRQLAHAKSSAIAKNWQHAQIALQSAYNLCPAFDETKELESAIEKALKLANVLATHQGIGPNDAKALPSLIQSAMWSVSNAWNAILNPHPDTPFAAQLRQQMEDERDAADDLLESTRACLDNYLHGMLSDGIWKFVDGKICREHNGEWHPVDAMTLAGFCSENYSE